MRVLTATIDLEFPQDPSAKSVMRKHAFYSVLDDKLRLPLNEVFDRNDLCTSRVA